MLVSQCLLQEVNTVEAAGLPTYFPLSRGRYEVTPGLMPLGSDLGNGPADRQVFQFDHLFADYRQVKLLARAERLDKYYQTAQVSTVLSGAIVQWMVAQLIREHPHTFSCPTAFTLHNRLTDEMFVFDDNWQLQQVQSPQAITPAYASALDALACQIQEDLTVVCRATDGMNWLSLIHLCYPNHWAAETKIGQDFATIHAPVAGIEAINRRAGAIVQTMITRSPMVRFAWGLSTDTRLNHHPEPPAGVAMSEWQGRQFDRSHPRLYLRIERQVIWGLPAHNAAVFTIRTYFRDCHVLKRDPDRRSKLVAAIQSMSSESLKYKGLVESRDEILSWLSEG